MAEADRVEAGGHEDDLRRIVDEVEAEREGDLGKALGRKARAEIVAGIRAEILRRFEERHPGVRARFLTGPYRDPDVPVGTKGRTR